MPSLQMEKTDSRQDKWLILKETLHFLFIALTRQANTAQRKYKRRYDRAAKTGHFQKESSEKKHATFQLEKQALQSEYLISDSQRTYTVLKLQCLCCEASAILIHT